MCLIYLILFWPYVFCLFLAVPAVAYLTALIYSAAIPGCYVAGLVKVLLIRPPSLPAPRWSPPRAQDGEPAELSYYYGPAFAEVHHVAAVSVTLARRQVDRGIAIIRALLRGQVTPTFRTKQIFTVPVALGAIFGLVTGVVFGVVAFAAIAVIHAIVAAFLFAVMRVTGSGLRVIDSGLLRVKNIRMTCPHCFERVNYPVYKCPGGECERLHRDVRPGRYGVFRRRCLCGTMLPTLLLLGSARLAAYCPYKGCGRSLEHRPGEAQEIVLPFFGAAGAGKTRLMYGIVALLRSARGLETEFADAATGLELSEVQDLLAPGKAPAKTAVALPRGQLLRVKSAGGTRLLQLYDGAGERFYRSETTQELGFLSKARTFVLVIDPLSVDYLWRTWSPERQAELAAVRSQAPSPDLAYQQTHQQMEAMGVKLKKARLAVVFSRADLLPSADDQPVEEWARDTLGLDNLVRSVRHQFGEIEFFRTASVRDDAGDLHPSVIELTRWLVSRDGISLPPQGNGSAS